MKKEDLPAIRTNRWIQLHGLWRLQHIENIFWWVLVIVLAIGLSLREDIVRGWTWAGSFSDAVRTLVPAVDLFWQVSPFPATSRLLIALAWLVAFAFGLIAVMTVKHLRFPAMYAPANTLRYWLGLLCVIGFIALMGWNPGVLTEEKLARNAFPWSILRSAVQSQVAFSLLAGAIAGLVAVCWSGLCVVAVKRFAADR